MAKILWYLAFLTWFFGAFFAGIWLSIRAASRPESTISKIPVLRREVNYLITATTLYVCVLLLARFSILSVSVLYFLGAQVEILVSLATGVTAINQLPTRLHAEMALTSRRSKVPGRPPPTLLTTILIQLIILVAYPAVAGLAYFFNAVPSSMATYASVRITLAYVLIFSLVSILPTQTGIALSENLSNASRWRYFTSLVAALVPTGILFATFLWTFSPANARTATLSLSFHVVGSSTVLLVMATYFLIALLLPNVIGAIRGARRQRQFLSQCKEALSKATRILMTPIPDLYDRELSDLAAQLGQQLAEIDYNKTGVSGKDTSTNPELPLDQRQEITAHPPNAAAKTSIYALGDGNAPESGAPEPVHKSPPLPTIRDKGPSELSLARSNAVSSSPVTDPPNSLLKAFEDRNYNLARRWNPRIQQINWLSEQISRVKMTASHLVTESGDARVRAAVAWAHCYRQDRRDLIEAGSETSSNTLGVVIISTIVTTVATVFFTSFGNWLWTYAAHALPK